MAASTSRAAALMSRFKSNCNTTLVSPTPMVGKSTCGSGATGNNWKATTPERNIAMVISVVATGRRTNAAEKLEEEIIAAFSPRAPILLQKWDCQNATRSGAKANQTPDTPPAWYTASTTG